jgi:hypothetical protein
MPTETKEIVDGTVYREKTLGLPRGLEPPHLPFLLPCRLMRDLRPVVASAVLAVADAGQQLSVGGATAAQPISHN